MRNGDAIPVALSVVNDELLLKAFPVISISQLFLHRPALREYQAASSPSMAGWCITDRSEAFVCESARTEKRPTPGHHSGQDYLENLLLPPKQQR